MDSTDSSDRVPPAENSVPLISLTLRDGATLSVAPDAITRGGETFALERVQDARRIVPEPETIGLRVAGRGLVEFVPAHPGDGALALEAIYRLRPDLRPAGFEPPLEVPAWWPPASEAQPIDEWNAPFGAGVPIPGPSDFGAAPSYRSGYQPPYSQFPLGARYPSPRIASPDGRLTPYPRDIRGMIGGTFRLFLAHWRVWLLLGLFTAGLPSIVSGALQMAIYAVQGHNPWRAIDTTTVSLVPSHLPHGGTLAALVILGLLLLAVLLLSGTWQVAVLADAGRRALLGESLDVRASLEAGVRRFVPVLLVTLALGGAAVLAIGVPVALLFGASALVGADPNTVPSGSLLTAALLGCLGFVALIAGIAVVVYAFGRLLLAPYIAATQPMDARTAILASWHLTRRRWWHVVIPLLAIGVVSLLVSAPIGNVELLSYALEALIAQPLVSLVLGPLGTLVALVVLYDLRLRVEGHEAILHKPST